MDMYVSYTRWQFIWVRSFTLNQNYFKKKQKNKISYKFAILCYYTWKWVVVDLLTLIANTTANNTKTHDRKAVQIQGSEK